EEHPSPPTAPVRSPMVRGAARGSSSLAFRIPLRSYRGSLARSRQVLVPVIASGRLGCHLHPAGRGEDCQAVAPIRLPCEREREGTSPLPLTATAGGGLGFTSEAVRDVRAMAQ